MNIVTTQLRSLFSAVLIVCTFAMATDAFHPPEASAQSCDFIIEDPYVSSGTVWTYSGTTCYGVPNVDYVRSSISLQRLGRALSYNETQGPVATYAYAGHPCPAPGSGPFSGESTHAVVFENGNFATEWQQTGSVYGLNC